MSATEPHILAVDLGTSAMKVALVAACGRVAGWETEPLHLTVTPDGGVEQDPQEWWQAFLGAAQRLLARQLVAADAVRAVCCSTQGEGTLPVDEQGQPLMNCILWMDMRGAPYLHRQIGGRVEVAGASLLKLRRYLALTGGLPSATGKDPAGHMLLVRERFPEIYARTYKFLNVLDYLNLRLTGRFTATFDSIVTSWVTDNRDPDRIRYDPGLIHISGIEAAKFPEIVPCTEVLGALKPEVAQALGLPDGVQVVAGAIDTTAAAVGSGAVADYQPHLYIGTSSWMAAHVPFKKTDIVTSMASIPCAVPGRYLLTALQATAGGNLTFMRDQLFCSEDELLPEAGSPDFFEALEAMAARTPPGSNGVLYTPWIWGERAPVEERTLRAGLLNVSLHNTRADVLRAVMEGIAFNTRWLLNPVVKFLGREVENIYFVGGGAQSQTWCQILADVLNVEIRQVREPIQANARGAAWIAAVGLREIEFQDVPKLAAFQQIYQPDRENRGLYDERFELFKKVYSQLRGVYRQLNANKAG